MRAFLDFEASSLAKQSYPIEVAWVFEDGVSETHLIRPAPDWDDWDPRSAEIHHIERATLLAEGESHQAVAQRMVEALTGHALFASAPSWDGKWLSTLLRAAGLPRHSLRLRATEAARIEAAIEVLKPAVPPAALSRAVKETLVLAELRGGRTPPLHRALADAQRERDSWMCVRDVALERAAAERAEAQAAPASTSSS
ncbi:3'-5' exonuclease family protein [Flavisphingomonas formosensis]|uniref:transcriptional regulator n=1 Tax=Flavisphingomonas formosensis TaxID=861534 RepID=UPI0012F829C6|nr:transcriptional regulator [Sphingomonas formosensis]